MNQKLIAYTLRAILFMAALGILADATAFAQSNPVSGKVLVAHPLGIDELSGADLKTQIQRIAWPDFEDGKVSVVNHVYDGSGNLYVLFLVEKDETKPRIGRFDFSKQSWDFPEWAQPEILRRASSGKIWYVGNSLIVGWGRYNQQLDLTTKKWYRLWNGSLGHGNEDAIYISCRFRDYVLKKFDLSDGSIISTKKLNTSFSDFVIDESGNLFSGDGNQRLRRLDSKNQLTTIQLDIQHLRKQKKKEKGLNISMYSYGGVSLLGDDKLLVSGMFHGDLTTINRDLEENSIKNHVTDFWCGAVFVVR